MDPLTEQVAKLVQVMSTQVPARVEWLTVEQYAAKFPVPDSIALIKRLLNPNLPKRSCPQYIHPDDVKRIKGVAVIRYCDFPYKGVSYPRWIAKP